MLYIKLVWLVYGI